MAEATATTAAQKPAKKPKGRPDSLSLLLNNTLATAGLVVFRTNRSGRARRAASAIAGSGRDSARRPPAASLG
jgi:hypothetical protein